MVVRLTRIRPQWKTRSAARLKQTMTAMKNMLRMIMSPAPTVVLASFCDKTTSNCQLYYSLIQLARASNSEQRTITRCYEVARYVQSWDDHWLLNQFHTDSKSAATIKKTVTLIFKRSSELRSTSLIEIAVKQAKTLKLRPPK